MRAAGPLPWRRTSCPCRHRVRQFASIQDSTRRSQHAFRKDIVRVSDEVQEALETNKPVVALETAIYTHGFPSPDNLELAVNLENKIREHDAVPATIGVVDGEARVGLGYKSLYRLCQVVDRGKALKLSRRDLPYILGMKSSGKTLSGGTTVSATMILAHLAGIDVFATGGLGGVHAGGELSLDISADLRELGRTPVAVVSSGCKSFLDISRTLEYLETEGVAVSTFADRKEGDVDFPAFWSRTSGVRSPSVIHNTQEAAAIIHAHSSLSLSSGMLFANPIPIGSEIPRQEMEGIVSTAVDEARSSGMVGRDNTPFVLKRINELTQGKSSTANKALVESNVVTAARIAVKLAEIRKDVPREGGHSREPLRTASPNHRNRTLSPGNKRFFSTALPVGRTNMPAGLVAPPVQRNDGVDVTVAGSMSVDLSCDILGGGYGPGSAAQPLRHTSNPASFTESYGGVGYNIATAIQLLHPYLRFCTLVADDSFGQKCWHQLRRLGLLMDGVMTEYEDGLSTARYVAINDGKKDLVMAAADMSLFETMGSRHLAKWELQLKEARPAWLVLDANWDSVTLRGWIEAGTAAGAKILYEPVSVAKAARLFRGGSDTRPILRPFPDHEVHVATPNEAELAAMHKAAKDSGHFDHPGWQETLESAGAFETDVTAGLVTLTSPELVARGIPQMSLELLPLVPCVITTLGPEGVLLTKLVRPGDPLLDHPSQHQLLAQGSSAKASGSSTRVFVQLYPPPTHVPGDKVVSVNGAGDTFVGVLVAGLCKSERPALQHLIELAQKGSAMTLGSKHSVHPDLWKLSKRTSLYKFKPFSTS